MQTSQQLKYGNSFNVLQANSNNIVFIYTRHPYNKPIEFNVKAIFNAAKKRQTKTIFTKLAAFLEFFNAEANSV